MYMHAGSGTVVRAKEIVGIFDLDGKITTAVTAEFLRSAERAKKTELAGEDLPKAFLLTASERRRRGQKVAKERVIFTHVSSGVLGKRIIFP